MATSGGDHDNRPRVAVRFRGARQNVALPIVRLEQRSNGLWYAVVSLPRWVDDGRDLIPWDEEIVFPPGQFEVIPGEDYTRLRRVKYGQSYAR